MVKDMVLAAAVAVLAVGCTETAGTRVKIDTDSGEASVLEASTRLANRVKVNRVTYGDVDGIRKATVTIESISHKRLELQARMVWMDAEGVEIDADGKSFRSIVLDGKDSYTFTGMAPNAKGVKARLVLRETASAE